MKAFLLSSLLLALGAAQQNSYDVYGQKINPTNPSDTEVFVSEVGEMPQKFKVEGVVEEVCQMKGCWLTLQNDKGANIRVTFKDYGFFVPKGISGKKVIVEGEAKRELLDADVAKHYAEDGGKVYTASMRSAISFVAHGVLVEK